MKRKTVLNLIILSLLAMIFVPVNSSIAEGGLLPSLTETVGTAMPSLGEALERYPDSEEKNDNGDMVELYTNVTESDFNTFSVYLEQQGAELADYKVQNGVLSAEIRANNCSFSLAFDTGRGEVQVVYPAGTFDARARNARSHYDAAVKLIEEGMMDEACKEIAAIPQYSAYGPVDRLLKENGSLAEAIEHSAGMISKEPEVEVYGSYEEVGSIVLFGTYPQTAEGTDKTPIRWIVLDYDAENHRSLLISKYGLDAKPYNVKSANITWEKSSLRTWLNNEFLNKAFNADEQSAILATKVNNGKSQGYSRWKANDGKNTQDKIFLLSYAEANGYFDASTSAFDSDTKSRVAPTDYAIAMGAMANGTYRTADGKAAGGWWLRSPGDDWHYKASVTSDGLVRVANIINDKVIVRPAFWLNLDSDIF